MTKLLDYFERSCIWGKPLLTKPLAKRVVASGGKTSTSSAPVQPTTRADDASGSSRASSTSTAKVTSTASTTNSQVAGMKEPCFKEDMRWDPLDMDVIRYPAMLMEDPSECQAWCKATRGCEHFSFYKVDGSCHITGNGSYKMPMSLGFISGPKKMRPRIRLLRAQVRPRKRASTQWPWSQNFSKPRWHSKFHRLQRSGCGYHARLAPEWLDLGHRLPFCSSGS